MRGDVPNVTTCAIYQGEILKDFDSAFCILQSEFPFFLKFLQGLTTVQCYCAACDVCLYATCEMFDLQVENSFLNKLLSTFEELMNND